MGKPDCINAGVNLVANFTTNGLCITLNKNLALFKSPVDLYAKAFWVLSKDGFMLTLVRSQISVLNS
jgi:hypothetical protein